MLMSSRGWGLQSANSFVSLAGKWAIAGYLKACLTKDLACPLSFVTSKIHRVLAFFTSPVSSDRGLHLPGMPGPLCRLLCLLGPDMNEKKVVLVCVQAGAGQQPDRYTQAGSTKETWWWLREVAHGRQEVALIMFLHRGCDPLVSLLTSVGSTGPWEEQLVFLTFG